MKSAALLPWALALALCTVTAWAEEAAHAPAAKPDLAKGEATSNGVCVACHTNDGSPGRPQCRLPRGAAESLSYRRSQQQPPDERRHARNDGPRNRRSRGLHRRSALIRTPAGEARIV